MKAQRADMISNVAARTLLLAGMWWLIVQGRADAWVIGLPFVVLATLARLPIYRIYTQVISVIPFLKVVRAIRFRQAGRIAPRALPEFRQPALA